jgi:hypothetical protein
MIKEEYKMNGKMVVKKAAGKSLGINMRGLALALALAGTAGMAHAETLRCQLGILDLNANSGTNPATGNMWAAGDKYRLIFVTGGTTECTSTDISTYNSFVQGVADASTAFPTLKTVTWKVVGSTATVAARDNTGTNPGVNGVGEAVFRMDGAFAIANNYADLWNGIIASHVTGQDFLAVHLDENGVVRTDERVRTGSVANGTASGTQMLGTGDVQTGRNYAPNGYLYYGGDGWMADWHASGPGRVYAISEPLTIIGEDTTPPTLVALEHDKGAGPVLVNEPVTYTVTFSEAMNASSVNPADFGNTTSTVIIVNSVTPTANPAVFTVVVTPTEPGLLQLQINAGAALLDLATLALVTTSALPDDSTLVVQYAPPTPTTVSVVSSGTPTMYGQNVTFTATVSPTPSGGTIQFKDGGIALGTPVTVNTGNGQAAYSSTALGAATHEITAEYSGNFAFEPSINATPFSHVVDKAPLSVKAFNAVRAPYTANPAFSYWITGFQRGETLATSGVTGTPDLTTAAVLQSPAGDYAITCALGSLAASNYSFTFVNGVLTVLELEDIFSVNFFTYGGLTTEEQYAHVRIAEGMPAGMSGWYASGWLNYYVPWNPGGPQAPVTLTSTKGATATFLFKDCRNGGTYRDGPRTTLLGDGNGNMMDGHINSTLDGDYVFDMEVNDITFPVYDVIFYMGANAAQFGDGTGVIKFNGAERAFKLKPGAFDGSFIEMVDATTQGNYIVFKKVTGSSFTAQTWGLGDYNFNHVGPFGFQIKDSTPKGSVITIR